MTNQMLIYERATPITVAQHRDISVLTGSDYSFARKINAAPLMATEFSSAAPEYAIVFAGNEDRVMPAVILGARQDENLFVKADGSWDAKYRPAFLRQYPFVFAGQQGGETLTLCLDEGFDGVNTEGRGERLFDSRGERTGYLNRVVEFSQHYQRHFRRTEQFCSRLREHDLLEPMQAQFRIPDGSRLQLTGFLAVNRTKLKQLPAEALTELAASDELELIYIHLQSLRNFDALIGRLEGAKVTSPAKAEGEESSVEDETEITTVEPTVTH